MKSKEDLQQSRKELLLLRAHILAVERDGGPAAPRRLDIRREYNAKLQTHRRRASIFKTYQKELLGGGCTFNTAGEPKTEFTLDEYNVILEAIISRDEERKKDIDRLRSNIHSLIQEYEQKIENLSEHTTDCEKLKEHSMTSKAIHTVGTFFRSMNPRYKIAKAADRKATEILEKTQESGNIALKAVGEEIAKQMRNKTVRDTLETYDKRILDWNQSRGTNAQSKCERELNVFKRCTEHIKTLQGLNTKLDSIDLASLVQAQHNDMVKITQNCTKLVPDDDAILLKLRRNPHIRILQTSIYNDKYAELITNSKTINDNIEEHIFTESWLGVDIGTFINTITNLILPQTGSKDNGLGLEAWKYSEAKINEYIQNITKKSSDLSDKDKTKVHLSEDAKKQVQKDLSTLSYYACNPCECEPESEQEHGSTRETYTRCLGNTWSDDHQKLITEISATLQSLQQSRDNL